MVTYSFGSVINGVFSFSVPFPGMTGRGNLEHNHFAETIVRCFGGKVCLC